MSGVVEKLPFLLLAVAISFKISCMKPKIIMSEYVVPQLLFIDIETDDLE